LKFKHENYYKLKLKYDIMLHIETEFNFTGLLIRYFIWTYSPI